MKITKYISVFALALVFAATSCDKLGGDLVECEVESSQEKTDSPDPTMLIVTDEDDENYNPGGITDPDHDEDHDRDEEKVVVIN
ncbi:MAG: hypothetical protein ACI9N1_001209 [Flavobacteriales bacterium]|jgi:hypothetical protein